MPSFVGNSQFLTTFGAATGQYSSTISSRHPLAETVLISSFALRRLKRSFHRTSFLIGLAKIGNVFTITNNTSKIYLKYYL